MIRAAQRSVKRWASGLEEHTATSLDEPLTSERLYARIPAEVHSMKIRPNRVKEKLAAGEAAYVVVLHDPDSIDIFGPNGFDGVWLESEHGPNDFADVSDLTRACDLWGMTPLLRVNRNERSLIYRALDRGAQGVIVPHVKTRAEAESIALCDHVVDGQHFIAVGRGRLQAAQLHDMRCRRR